MGEVVGESDSVSKCIFKKISLFNLNIVAHSWQLHTINNMYSTLYMLDMHKSEGVTQEKARDKYATMLYIHVNYILINFYRKFCIKYQTFHSIIFQSFNKNTTVNNWPVRHVSLSPCLKPTKSFESQNLSNQK